MRREGVQSFLLVTYAVEKSESSQSVEDGLVGWGLWRLHQETLMNSPRDTSSMGTA